MNKKALINQKNLTDQLDRYYAFSKHKDMLWSIKNRKTSEKGSVNND